MGGVGEAEHVVTDKVAGGRYAEWAAVVVGGDDWELLHDVPAEVGALYFLSCEEIEREAVKVGEKAACSISVEFVRRG